MDSQNGGTTSNQYNYYQNLYNMFGGYNPVIDKKAKGISMLGFRTGLACVLFVLLQYVFVLFLNVTGLIKPYSNDAVIQNGINALASAFYIFLPFLIVYFLSPDTDKKRILSFDAPKNMPKFVLAVATGFGVCLASNFIGELLLGFFSLFGVEFASGMENVPTADNLPGYVLTVIGTAIVPALFEEFAFRGVVLQPLRKYGDKFAIGISAFLFAVLHGNMVQAPMAFLVGIVMGYLCITTGTIWTTVTIHFLNNLLSVFLTFYYNKYPDASDFPVLLVLFAFVVIGAVAFVVYSKMNTVKLVKINSELDSKTKRSLYLCTPTVIFIIIYSVYTTITLCSISKFAGVILIDGIIIAAAVLGIKRVNRIKNDNRIRANGFYTVSKVFMIIAPVILCFINLAMISTRAGS